MYELLRMEVARRLIKRPPTLLERYPMWHGTTEERVQKITRDKFDRGKAGTNGQYTSIHMRSHWNIMYLFLKIVEKANEL